MEILNIDTSLMDIQKITNIYNKYSNKSLEEKHILKKEIEDISDIIIFVYQSPQASEYESKNKLDLFDVEYLYPTISRVLWKDIDELNITIEDIQEIKRSYKGQLGIFHFSDVILEQKIEKFINDTFNEDGGDHNEEIYLELYNKNNVWCEIHIQYDEDVEDFLLMIDEIPANQKILATRDFSYESFNFSDKNSIKEILYNYFDIQK